MTREFRNNDDHLLDRLLGENAELRKQNTALQQSVTRLELFNKIVERENAELRERLSSPASTDTDAEASRSRGGWILTLVIIGLLAAGTYILYSTTKTGDKTHAPLTEQKNPDTIEVRALPPVTAGDTPHAKPAEPTPQRDPVEPQGASIRQVSAVQEHTGAARYKVRSRAYFHNEPDVTSRRAAFITHWNNAVLTPQKESGDFVYIVFKNHLGQTSRGWLRKDELIPAP